MYFQQLVLLKCLIVSSFASQSSNTVSGQSWKKIDFPLQVWNLFSSDQTEEVTIVSNALSSGTIRCGVACQINPDCGGFLFDKASGSCSMKHVKKLFPLNFLISFCSIVYVSTIPADSFWSSEFCGSLCQAWKIGSILLHYSKKRES